VTPQGFRHLSGFLDDQAQRDLAGDVMAAARRAPFYRALTPWGRPMSVTMTNFGARGWLSQPCGYSYSSIHPLTGAPWPPIPGALLVLWAQLADATAPPDACLVNLYRDGARMGLHQDRDEADFSIPVLSVSLGDTGRFRIGGQRRGEPTSVVELASGDVCLLAGEARLAFHGIDRVIPGRTDIVPGGGRLNLTLRRSGPRP
jgi:alkylated DNA repair protein (DNA oxidative demethylase)